MKKEDASTQPAFSKQVEKEARIDKKILVIFAGIILIGLVGDVSASCFDGVQDGDEEGVDCGGSCPNVCVLSRYIDAENGNDLNDGLTNKTAWKTLARSVLFPLGCIPRSLLR